MNLGIPGPIDVLRAAEATRQAVADAVSLVPRLIIVVGRVESLLGRVDSVVTSIEETATRAERTVAGAERTVAGAERTAARAATLVNDLDPALTKLQPTLEALASTTSPDEVAAMVAVVDQLPELAERLEDEIMPILSTMSSVSPDLRDLLAASKELNELILNLPGMGRIRRKIDDEHDEHDEHDGDAAAVEAAAADPAPPPVAGTIRANSRATAAARPPTDRRGDRPR